jgi:dTDP-glucose pyrophosphorylase
MRGIILAAGKGKRLLPLTRFIAKALLPINGRPAIEQIVELFRDCGISEIAIVIGHLGDQIRAHLDDGSKFGVKIFYREQIGSSGTSKAVEAATDLIIGDVLVAASDCLLPREHLRGLLRYHIKERNDATLSLKLLPRSEILSSATVSLREDGTISKIIEKPSEDEILSDIASSPYYVFGEIVVEYLPRVKKSKRDEYELIDVIQMMIDDGLRVKGLVSDEWKHLSDLNALIKLNQGNEAKDKK